MSCQPLDEGLAAVVSMKTLNAPFDMAIGVVGNKGTLDISMPGVTGLFRYEIWLTDLPTTPNERTRNPPDEDATTVWKLVTEADGTLTHCFIHNGDPQTWTINAVLLGPLGQISMAFV